MLLGGWRVKSVNLIFKCKIYRQKGVTTSVLESNWVRNLIIQSLRVIPSHIFLLLTDMYLSSLSLWIKVSVLSNLGKDHVEILFSQNTVTPL